MTAQIIQISDSDYYADKYGDKPNLHASTAGVIVNDSPLHAYHSHVRLGGAVRTPTTAQDEGNVIHKLLLEGGKGIEVLDYENFQTKQAKEDRDTARHAGFIPILKHRFKELKAAAQAITKRLKREFKIVLDGQSEVAIAWEELTKHGPVSCLGKLDHDHEATRRVFDVKSTSGSISLEACQRRIFDAGYDVQASAYISAKEKQRPDLAGLLDFVWLFVEIDPPYAVTPLTRSGTLKQLGDLRWARACERWAWCLKKNKWPGHVTELTRVEALPWALQREIENGSNV